MKQGLRIITAAQMEADWWEGLTAKESAAKHNCAVSTVHNWRKRLGLPGVETIKAWAMRCERKANQAS